MNPVEFEEANIQYGPPKGYEESQVMPLKAYAGETQSGSVDGAPVTVVCWKPTEEEIESIAAGNPIFITFLFNGLPPHYPSMSFYEATHPT